VRCLQLLGRDVLADVHVAVEGDAFRLHLLHATRDDVLLHLEVGDAVGEETARARVLLIDVHVVAHACELLRSRQPGRTRADDGDALAGLALGRLGRDPAFLEGPVGDRALDGFDGDRHVVDVERTGGLAGRGADAARNLGKIVGGVQIAGSRLPLVAIDEIVPVRDLVVDRTARVTVRDAAIHAAGRLLGDFLLGQRDDELAPMLEALVHRPVVPVLAVELHEARNLSHRPVSIPAPSS
jgi:hypothetical protein